MKRTGRESASFLAKGGVHNCLKLCVLWKMNSLRLLELEMHVLYVCNLRTMHGNASTIRMHIQPDLAPMYLPRRSTADWA